MELELKLDEDEVCAGKERTLPFPKLRQFILNEASRHILGKFKLICLELKFLFQGSSRLASTSMIALTFLVFVTILIWPFNSASTSTANTQLSPNYVLNVLLQNLLPRICVANRHDVLL